MTTIDGLVQSQRAHALAGGQLMGEQIFWSLKYRAISQDSLIALAEEHGLPARYLPSQITPIRAFRRAVKSVEGILDKSGYLLEWLKQPEGSEDKRLMLSVLHRQIQVSDRQASHTQVNRIYFDPESQEVSSDSYFAFLDQVRVAYENAKLHSLDDIRKILVGVANEYGVSMREGGGLYWIPVEKEELVSAAISVVGAVNSENQIYRFPMYSSPTGNKSMRDLAIAALHEEVNDFAKAVRGLEGAEKESTWRLKLSQGQGIEARIELFKGSLDINAGDYEDLRQKLARAMRPVQEKLGINPDVHVVSANVGHRDRQVARLNLPKRAVN